MGAGDRENVGVRPRGKELWVGGNGSLVSENVTIVRALVRFVIMVGVN